MAFYDNNPVWDSLLDLFPDNSNGEISPADIRAFVKTVRLHKPTQIHKEEKLIDIWTNPDIYASDMVIINNRNIYDPDMQYNGIYVVLLDRPNSLNDLQLITKSIIKSDDTPDLYKPISNDTQQALDEKFDKIGGKISGDIEFTDSNDNSRLVLQYDEGSGNGYILLKDINGNVESFLKIEPNGNIVTEDVNPLYESSLTTKKWVESQITQNFDSKEDNLGNPSLNNMYLSSDMSGNRTWKYVNTTWGNITGDINNQGDLITILDTKWDGSQELPLGYSGAIIYDFGEDDTKNILSYTEKLDSNNQPYAAISIGDTSNTVDIRGKVSSNFLLHNDVGIYGFSEDNLNLKNMIHRTGIHQNNGTPGNYNNDIIVGDSDVLTAIFASNNYDPVVRKGTFGNSVDYKIYTTEDFLSSDFAPTIHTHLYSDIPGLETDLNNKASLVHTHTYSDIPGLETDLNNKASSVHTHTYSDIPGLETDLNNKANISHNHTIDEVVDLQDTLDTKWDGSQEIVWKSLTPITDENNKFILKYEVTGNESGDFFDFKTSVTLTDYSQMININGTVSSPFVLKNNNAIKGWNSDYSNTVNLISRTSDNPYDNEVVIGDSNVRSVIRCENNTYDPMVRKGIYGSTTDYMIYTTEHFDYTNIAPLMHNHDISDITDLWNQLNNKFNISGGTISGNTKIEGVLNLPSQGRVIEFNDLQQGNNVLISNLNSNDNIIKIEKGAGVNRYYTKFYGPIEIDNGLQDYHATRKDYVDNNLDLKYDKTGGNVSGQIDCSDNIHCNNLYSRNEVTARSIVSTGINANDNSAIQFNYMNGLNGVLWYDNSESIPENRFKIDITLAEEEYILYHSGNLNLSNYLDKTQDQIIEGSIVINSGDALNPSNLSVISSGASITTNGDSIFSNNSGLEFLITNDSTDITIDVNTVTEMSFTDAEPPSIYKDASSDNHLTRKSFIDNNYLSLQGGILSGDLVIGDGDINDDTPANIIIKNNSRTDSNNGIYFTRNDDTNRFIIDTDDDTDLANLKLFDNAGVTLASLEFKLNGNISLIDTAVPNGPYDIIIKNHFDSEMNTKADLTYTNDQLDTKLNLTGGTVTGQIKGITPVDDDDLTRKDYVDTTVTGAVLNTASSLGTSLSRAEIDNVVGASTLDMNKDHQFYIIDADEHVFFVRWFSAINKFAYERLTVR